MTTIAPIKNGTCSTCQENAHQCASVLQQLGATLQQLGQEVKVLRDETASLRKQVTILTQERNQFSDAAKNAESELITNTAHRVIREELLRKVYRVENAISRLDLQDQSAQKQIGWGWTVGAAVGVSFGGIGPFLIGSIMGLVCTMPPCIAFHLKCEEQKKALLIELEEIKQKLASP